MRRPRADVARRADCAVGGRGSWCVSKSSVGSAGFFDGPPRALCAVVGLDIGMVAAPGSVTSFMIPAYLAAKIGRLVGIVTVACEFPKPRVCLVVRADGATPFNH